MADIGSASPAGAHPHPEGTSGLAAWRELVMRAGGGSIERLRSQTRDAIPIEPLYPPGRDGLQLPGRGARPWIVVQPVDGPEPDRANERAHVALAGGAGGLSLRFAEGTSAGATDLPSTPEALGAALEGMDFASVQIRLEPHGEGPRIAENLSSLILRTGLAPERADVSFGLDPLALLAAGEAVDQTRLASAFLALRDARFRGPFALLDGRPFHEAGATEAQELAAILGSAAWWLRALDNAGAGPHVTLPGLGASVSVDCDVLVSICKLRALRVVWARLAEVCGTAPAPLQLHAETSLRMQRRDELLDNLLLNTMAAFAAGVGGADAVSVRAHTAAIGVTDRNARALARNIQHLLMQESGLHRVADPAAGSGAVEALTQSLAERAWAEFLAIEREGGIVASVGAGLFQARIGTPGGASGTGAARA